VGIVRGEGARPQKGLTMSLADKARNKAEEWKGEAKEKYGDATDNESLQAEGTAEATKARAKQAGEHIHDAGEDAADVFRK
jgi:uncharacterized protein YjbJ (UPF0337 family)